MKCVIDASFFASLFLPDEASGKATAQVENLKAGEAQAPALLQIEVSNILIMAHRRRRITGVERNQISDAFDQFPIIFHPAHTAHQRAIVLALADKHKLSAYDATYLELALRLDMPLLTLDKNLLKAAKDEGLATEF